MVTFTQDESVSFTLMQTNAFFLWGAVNFDHGPKTATITPNNSSEEARTISLNDFSSLLDFKQIIYWESGLDRDQNYTVTITQTAPGAFSFSRLDIIDRYVYTHSSVYPQLTGFNSGSAPDSSPIDPPTGGSPPSQSLSRTKPTLSTGALVGIAVSFTPLPYTHC